MGGWNCVRCKAQCDKRTLHITRCPQSLIVNFERVRSDPNGDQYKADNMIDYPLIFDLKKYGLVEEDFDPTQSTTYELYAVDNHHGGISFAHLMATTKNALDHQWYHFDDAMVVQVPETHENVKSDKANVIYYRRLSKAAEDARKEQNILHLWIHHDGEIFIIEAKPTDSIQTIKDKIMERLDISAGYY